LTMTYSSNPATRSQSSKNAILFSNLWTALFFYVIFFFTFYALRRGLQTLSLRCLLYEGRAAGFEPELVKLAALPRYQWAIPALYVIEPVFDVQEKKWFGSSC
jgi:hypothetical protein